MSLSEADPTPGFPPTPVPDRDLLGCPLDPVERRLLDVYARLTELAAEDLAPCVAANVKEAVAVLWQALNDLALTSDRPDV